MAKTHHSPYTLEILPQDVPSWVFSSGTPESRRRPQYFDADNPARNFSLEHAESLVKRFGQGLQDLGLKPGDKVLLYAGNSLYFPVFLWGTIASGCIFTGCSPGASITELSYQLEDSGAKIVVTSAACAPAAIEAAAKAGLSRDSVYEFCEPDASPTILRSWTEIWTSEERASSWKWRSMSSKEDAASTIAVLNYSSGTTGLPKGTLISHYNLVSNSEQVLFKRNLVADTPRGRARKLRLETSGERWLAPLPMFHAYGQAYFCMSAARDGVKVFIMPKYDIFRYLTYLDTYRITFLTGVPSIMVSLAKHARARDFNLGAIESVVTGSAPLNPEIGALVAQTLLRPGIQVKQGWGLTETTCSATGFAPDDEDDGKSIGWLNPNVCAKIVAVPERDFGTESGHVVGEIWLSGPNITCGYHNRPTETAEMFARENGRQWLRTGDVGYVDDRGCFYIVDRLKELIKVKGLQVAPAEIEQTLLLHPGVVDAAVIGVKIDHEEHPKAFVVSTPGYRVSPAALQRWVEQKLARHKWLTAGVTFIDAVPRTASGKVIRRALATMETDARESGSKL